MKNTEGLLPPDDPQAPHYWMWEESGVLAPAVHAYLRNEALTDVQIGALRAYFRQWIGSPVWNQNPHMDEVGKAQLEALRRGVETIRTREDADAWVKHAVAQGLDPL